MTQKSHHILLGIILLIAIFFRFFRLTSSPPALNWDEVSIGYNAYSILKTGRDEWGKFLPLSFKAFGEHKLPGMIYASIPGIAIFGLNDFGVRATPAIIGVITVYLFYLFIKQLFGSDKYALSGALLLAISPWHVHFSRISFEAGLALSLTTLSLYYLLRARGKPVYYWPSAILAILAAYSYNSVRILLPLLLVTYLLNKVVLFTKSARPTILKVIILGLLLCLPIFKELGSSEGRVRWQALSITTQKSFTDGIAESRGYTTLPSILPRLIHNKATHYTHQFFLNYLSTFSTEFLYLSGSTNTQRSTQGMGLFYYFELPLLVIGLIALLSKNDKRSKLARSVLFPLIFLSPIPSALTIDAPSSVRTLTLLVAFIPLEALGLSTLLNKLKDSSRLLKLTLLGFALWCVSYFAYSLYLVYPVKYASDWAYGYRESLAWVFTQTDSVDQVYITSKYGEPYIYTLFYGQIDPKYYQQVEKHYSIDPLGWVHLESFGKYYFTDFYGLKSPQEIIKRTSGRSLLLTPFAALPAGINRAIEVKAPTWQVMFEGAVVEGEQE